jgi:hypothetical protein
VILARRLLVVGLCIEIDHASVVKRAPLDVFRLLYPEILFEIAKKSTD